MFKIVTLLLLLSSYLFSQNLNSAVLNKHAFVLPQGKLEMKAAYLKVNDTLDVLNVKESEIGNLDRFGAIGDMNGHDIELRYGLTDKDSLYLNYQRWNVDYADETLKNTKIDFFNRYNIISNNHNYFNALSFDVGFTHDSSSDLNMKNDAFLNSLIKKIRPGSGFSFNDGSIVSGDTTFSLFDENGKIYPSLSIGDLESTSYYARVLLGKVVSDKSLLSFYIGYKYIDIKTTLDFYPNDNAIINSTLGNIDLPNLDRKEENFNLGLAYTKQLNDYLLEFNYEFNRLSRDDESSYIDYNHIVDASISKIITKDLLLYVGGRLMLQQFNTDIPYLYNQYSKTQFDKKYGFAKLGLVYSFMGSR